MRLLVLDASVAAKWFLPRADERLVEEAFDLLRGHVRGNRVHSAGSVLG